MEFWAAMPQIWKEKPLWQQLLECMNLYLMKSQRGVGLRRRKRIDITVFWFWKNSGTESCSGKTFFQISKKNFPENVPHLFFSQLSSDKHSWTLRTFYLSNAQPSNPSPHTEQFCSSLTALISINLNQQRKIISLAAAFSTQVTSWNSCIRSACHQTHQQQIEIKKNKKNLTNLKKYCII